MKDDFNETGWKSVAPSGPLEKALIEACEKGETAKVAELIAKGANVFVSSEKPLLLAASNGHLDVVKLLVAEGSIGIMRYTAPTFQAQKNGHYEIANYLKQAMRERQWKGTPPKAA